MMLDKHSSKRPTELWIDLLNSSKIIPLIMRNILIDQKSELRQKIDIIQYFLPMEMKIV